MQLTLAQPLLHLYFNAFHYFHHSSIPNFIILKCQEIEAVKRLVELDPIPRFPINYHHKMKLKWRIAIKHSNISCMAIIVFHWHGTVKSKAPDKITKIYNKNKSWCSIDLLYDTYHLQFQY